MYSCKTIPFWGVKRQKICSSRTARSSRIMAWLECYCTVTCYCSVSSERLRPHNLANNGAQQLYKPGHDCWRWAWANIICNCLQFSFCHIGFAVFILSPPSALAALTHPRPLLPSPTLGPCCPHPPSALAAFTRRTIPNFSDKRGSLMLLQWSTTVVKTTIEKYQEGIYN